MKRMWTAVIGVGIVWAAPVLSGQQAATHMDHLVVVGCLAQSGNALVLTGSPIALTEKPRSAGSSSAKASVPLGSAHGSIADRSSAGSNSAKASTPVRTSGGAASEPRTASVMSAKGSVPILQRAVSETTYQLEVDNGLLPSRLDRVLEVQGTIPQAASPRATATLKVERVNVTFATCRSRQN